MLFNSYAFLLVFLPAAILICFAVDSQPALRRPVLIALSLAFYSYWDIRFLPLMLLSIGVNWYLAGLYAATNRSALVTFGIVANLLVLGIFKYTNFFADNFAALGIPVGHFDIALPLGISFFIFHHIMYLIDLRAGKAPIYPLDRYALYICYFPQAISGPLARWSEVMDQFGQQIFRPGWEKRCAMGAALIVIGLLQIPAFYFLGTALGTSSAYVTISTTIASWVDPSIADITVSTPSRISTSRPTPPN